jgi:hypothetical protein
MDTGTASASSHGSGSGDPDPPAAFPLHDCGNGQGQKQNCQENLANPNPDQLNQNNQTKGTKQ